MSFNSEVNTVNTADNTIVHPRLTEKCPIIPFPHQKAHIQNIWKLLVEEKAFSYIDTSSTGLGKTHITLCVAWYLQKLYGTKVMIIAPSETSLKNKDGWIAHSEKYGIEILDATTYTSLRGGQGKVSHPWLIPNKEKKKSWEASSEFNEICQRGLLLIFDEFHNAKNASVTHFACAALVRAAKKFRSVCRVALLSHTPGDKIEVMPQLLRMTGLITEMKLFKHIPFTTNQYEWKNHGLGELARVCSKIGGRDVQKVVDREMNRFSAVRANTVCKNLYEKYIRDIITFAMPKPEVEPKAVMLNAFLENDDESLELLNNGIALLSGAVGWDPVAQQVAPQAEWHLADIGRGLKIIEMGKISSIVRYIQNQSELYPEKKFVICCGARNIDTHDLLQQSLFKKFTPDSYVSVIEELRQKNENWKKLPKDMINYIKSFLNYNVPVDVINGTVSKKERTKRLEKFQSDSNDSWCLVISSGTGAESLSLHDKYGTHPREMLIIPDFFMSKMIQSSGRIVRVGMQSDAKVMFVYAKGTALETNILNSMIRKSQVARRLMAENQEVVFPGEFPFYIEGERNIELEQQLNMLMG